MLCNFNKNYQLQKRKNVSFNLFNECVVLPINLNADVVGKTAKFINSQRYSPLLSFVIHYCRGDLLVDLTLIAITNCFGHKKSVGSGISRSNMKLFLFCDKATQSA